MSELKPCPFDGDEVELCETPSGFRKVKYYVKCKSCGVNTFTMRENYSRDDAVRAWNRRASPWISVKDDLPLDGQWAVFGRKDIKHKELLQWQTWFARDHNVTKTGVIIISGLACTHWIPIPPLEEV